MYEKEIIHASKSTGVEIALIKAIIMAESLWDEDAKYKDKDGGKSYGLMQVRLQTAREMLDDNSLTAATLLEPGVNILIGAKYLKNSFSRWRDDEGTTDIKDVIASYNAGKPRKNRDGLYTNSKGDTKVQRYVDKVYRYYRTYKREPQTFGKVRSMSIIGVDGGDYTPLVVVVVVVLGFLGYDVYKQYKTETRL
jgi:soluble lytic murein transglycosylase-like protein